MTTKTCPHCHKAFSARTRYCSTSCRYWFNSIKKDKEAGLPPFRKRNRKWFSMTTGYGVAKVKGGTRAGRRSGGMIHGSMEAQVNCTTEKWVEINAQNLHQHFTCISFYRPNGILLGDGSYIKAADIEIETGIIFKLNNVKS